MDNEPLITIPFDPDFDTAIRPRCPGLNMHNTVQIRLGQSACRDFGVFKNEYTKVHRLSIVCNVPPIFDAGVTIKSRCDIPLRKNGTIRLVSTCRKKETELSSLTSIGFTCRNLHMDKVDLRAHRILQNSCYISDTFVHNPESRTNCSNLMTVPFLDVGGTMNYKRVLCYDTEVFVHNPASVTACRSQLRSAYLLNISAIPNYMHYACKIPAEYEMADNLIAVKACKTITNMIAEIKTYTYASNRCKQITIVEGFYDAKTYRCGIPAAKNLPPLMFGRVGKGKPVITGIKTSGRMNAKERPSS